MPPLLIVFRYVPTHLSVKIFSHPLSLSHLSFPCPILTRNTHTPTFNSSSTLLTIFGGKIQDLRVFLTDERLPDGWQPRVLHPMGLTMAEFNKTALKVEFGIASELPPSFGLGPVGGGVGADKKKA